MYDIADLRLRVLGLDASVMLSFQAPRADYLTQCRFSPLSKRGNIPRAVIHEGAALMTCGCLAEISRF